MTVDANRGFANTRFKDLVMGAVQGTRVLGVMATFAGVAAIEGVLPGILKLHFSMGVTRDFPMAIGAGEFASMNRREPGFPIDLDGLARFIGESDAFAFFGMAFEAGFRGLSGCLGLFRSGFFREGDEGTTHACGKTKDLDCSGDRVQVACHRDVFLINFHFFRGVLSLHREERSCLAIPFCLF